MFERRDSDSTIEVREENGATRIIGYAAVFDRLSHDLGGFVERIRPGAFKRVLNRGDDVFALFNHDMDNLLATRGAGTLRLQEDGHGLRYEFDLDPTDPDHQRVISKVRRGDLKGSSFGFRVGSDGDEWGVTDMDYPLRTLTDFAALRDVGPVTSPAYPDTATVAPLALRSLAELTHVPVDDLVAADSLKDFLLRMGEDAQTDIDDVASGDTDAASSGGKRYVLPPQLPQAWYGQYTKGSTSNG